MVIVFLIVLLLLSAAVYFKKRSKKPKEQDMVSGLQCFNEDGNLVVDLTDRQLVWFKEVKHTLVGVTDNPIDVNVIDIDPADTVGFLWNVKQIGTETKGILARNSRPMVTIPRKGIVRISSVERMGNQYGLPVVFTITFFKFKVS